MVRTSARNRKPSNKALAMHQQEAVADPGPALAGAGLAPAPLTEGLAQLSPPHSAADTGSSSTAELPRPNVAKPRGAQTRSHARKPRGSKLKKAVHFNLEQQESDSVADAVSNCTDEEAPKIAEMTEEASSAAKAVEEAPQPVNTIEEASKLAEVIDEAAKVVDTSEGAPKGAKATGPRRGGGRKRKPKPANAKKAVRTQPVENAPLQAKAANSKKTTQSLTVETKQSQPVQEEPAQEEPAQEEPAQSVGLDDLIAQVQALQLKVSRLEEQAAVSNN